MPDFVPANDSEMRTWLNNFVTVLNANLATVGLVAGDVTPLTSAQTAFSAAVDDQVAKDAVLRAAVQLKKTRRATLAGILRPLIRRISNHPGMTEALRVQLGLPPIDRIRTRASVGPEVPGMVLETRPGQVIIHFGTAPGNERTNAKPTWALGCNIYRKRGAETDFSLIAFDTASPYVDTVTGSAVNVAYRVAYRGVRATDEGAHSSEQSVAAGS